MRVVFVFMRLEMEAGVISGGGWRRNGFARNDRCGWEATNCAGSFG